MVKPPAKKYDPQEIELRLLEFWEKDKTFEKSMESRKGREPFIFLEGPPTANGLPGIHHVLARAYKDLVCRYKTMTGHFVGRKGGWDTHGLPVELEVEKSLGISTKQEIEEYGIAKFNEKCKESVFRYEKEWRQMTERMAFWIDMDDPYITLMNYYIESIWWALKKSWDADLLYKGHRVTPYCPRCGTPLSSHEVALGYEDVTEPSLTVKFKLRGRENEYVLAWTTTPWTLPGNVALAVGADIEYVKVAQKNEKGDIEYYYLARDCARARTPEGGGALKGDFQTVETVMGDQLEGLEYEPLYDVVPKEKLETHKAHYVALADFVTTAPPEEEEKIIPGTPEAARKGKFAGTGVVHTAVMYGEDDYRLGFEIGLPAHHTVDEAGRFNSSVKKWTGRWVKDCDQEIIQDLRDRGLLYDSFDYTHSYPFCWRCETPLLYYARDSWYIAMSKLRERIKSHNSRVNWYPPSLREGRFGNFLDQLKDWSLSRERFWGTPLPIWTCQDEKCGHKDCYGSAEDIRKAAGGAEFKDYHQPYIDELAVKCSKCGGPSKREPYVIDVWYDSGASFFAQWHYPFERYDFFHKNFPIDFICEGIDQTRGWFYSLLACATLTQDDLCYKVCLSTGHVLDKEGQKMSKSKGNIVDPWDIFKREGADALRWYLTSVNAPWAQIKFDTAGVKQCMSRFLMTYWNSYALYAQYAALDGFDYDEHVLAHSERPLLDRWLVSGLNTLVASVREELDNYEIHKAARLINDFVMVDLSNWYIRRSRKRFWTEELNKDKRAGYSTLHEALITVAKLAAPFVPYISEEIFQKTVDTGDSVHLQDMPVKDDSMVDAALEGSMRWCIELAEAGRRLRSRANIKTRQPLARAIVVPRGEVTIKGLENLLADEVNVKALEIGKDLGQFQETAVRPNSRNLGPRFRQHAKAIAEAVEALDPSEASRMLAEGRIIVQGPEGEVELGPEDIIVEHKADERYEITETANYAFVLDTELTEELLAEGLARELVRRMQQMRKDMDLDVDQKVNAVVECEAEVAARARAWTDYIKTEVRATVLELGGKAGAGHVQEWDIDGKKIRISLDPVQK